MKTKLFHSLLDLLTTQKLLFIFQFIWNFLLPDKERFIYGLEPNNAAFVGRVNEEKIISFYHSINKHVLICGKANIGKSELARKYAWDYKGNILWINSTSNEEVASEFKNVAHILGIERKWKTNWDLVSSVIRSLTERGVLVIFDKAQFRTTIIDDLSFLEVNQLKMIVTTRNTEWYPSRFQRIHLQRVTLVELITERLNLKADVLSYVMNKNPVMFHSSVHAILKKNEKELNTKFRKEKEVKPTNSKTEKLYVFLCLSEKTCKEGDIRFIIE